MKKSFPLFFTLVAASYSASVYSYNDAYHVLSSRIDIVQGAEIYGNGKMQSLVRVRYELDKDVTLTSITLKEFGTGVELASVGWENSDTDNGFDHNIGRSRKHSHTQAVLNNNEQYKNKYILTSKKNANINICYDIKTTKNNVESTYSTCFDEGIDHGSVNIFSRRPVHYSGSDFYFSNEKILLEYYREFVTYYYTLRKAKSIPDGMNFKRKKKDGEVTLGSPIILKGSNYAAARKYNQNDVNKNHSAYVHLWRPDRNDELRMSPSSAVTTDFYIKKTITSYDEKYSPVHIIVSELNNSTVYYNNSICYQFIPGFNQTYTCRDQDTYERLQNIEWKPVQESLGEKVSSQILIDNYGTEHQINIRLDEDGKPIA